MKRDEDYIRAMLFELENQDHPYMQMPKQTLQPQKPERAKRRYHMELLTDAGLMTHVDHDAYRLTNQGHDYIEAFRSDTVWKKTKEGAKTMGGATLGMMKDIAVAYLKQEAAEKLGISL